MLFASALLLGDTTMQFPIGWLADRLGRRARAYRRGGGRRGAAAAFAVGGGAAVGLLAVAVCARRGGGEIYTLSLVACGERFRGAALVSASSLVGASWSIASFGGPLVAGALMRQSGPNALVAVLVASAARFCSRRGGKRARSAR